MKLFKAYREGWQEYRRHRSLEKLRACPSLSPTLFFEISTAGVVIGKQKPGQVLILEKPIATSDYEEAIEEAVRKLASFESNLPFEDQKNKSPLTIRFHLWPMDWIHSTFLIGAGQPYPTAEAFDSTLQENPAALGLSSSYTYRSLDYGLPTRVDCIGLPYSSVQKLADATNAWNPCCLPSFHWAPLSAFQAVHQLLPFKMGDPNEKRVIVVADGANLFYGLFQGRNLIGLHIAKRSSLQKEGSIEHAMRTLAIQESAPTIWIILTKDVNDILTAHSQHNHSDSLMRENPVIFNRNELIKQLNQLASANSFSLLPLALLAKNE